MLYSPKWSRDYRNRGYLFNLVTWLSCGINCVLLGGSPYETFSARNQHWHFTGRWNMVGMIDQFMGRGHCLYCWHHSRERHGDDRP